MSDSFVVTCEHGGNDVPAAYQALFRGNGKLLNSHYGYDPGALDMARSLAAALDAPLVASTTSRLLIDLNRPVDHPKLFSGITRAAPAEMRAEIISGYHEPYQLQVEKLVSQLVARGRRVIHIASHSFTPELDGQVRSADVGLLYHPGRRGEVELCAHWKRILAEYAPDLRVRRNYPYRGKDAGLTAQLRLRFATENYVGIELEVNQSIVFAAGRCWIELLSMLPRSLLAACAA
jgi:predicted N-formylglutamate amidohydrolase